MLCRVTWPRRRPDTRRGPSSRAAGPRTVAAFLGQNGEVAKGEVAVDALIDAAKLVGTLERQDPPPAGSGLGHLARLAVQDGLAEMQLGVVEVDPQALGTRVQGRGKVAEHLVAEGNQGDLSMPFRPPTFPRCQKVGGPFRPTSGGKSSRSRVMIRSACPTIATARTWRSSGSGNWRVGMISS